MIPSRKNIIWICGLAGSGKTTLINFLKKTYGEKGIFLNDTEEILFLNGKDKNHKHHTHPDNHSFLLISNLHFDLSIKRLVEKAKKVDVSRPCFIEIGRGIDREGRFDISFKRALEFIPQEILKKSIFLRLELNWGKRLSRNKQRKLQPEEGMVYCPEGAMGRFFKGDDFDSVIKGNENLEVWVIKNDKNKKALEEKTKRLLTEAFEVIAGID